MTTTNEFLHYLKSHSEFHRCLEGFKRKYISLGHLGGVVIIKDPTIDELTVIGGFIGKDLTREKEIKLSYHQFHKALLRSRFYDVEMIDILQLYFNETLLPSKERKHQEYYLIDTFFNSILRSYQDSKAYEWLSFVVHEKTSVYRTLTKLYRDDERKAYHKISHVMDAINHLPVWTDDLKSIPVFASDIAHDPHYFDESTTAYTLLFHAISYLLPLEIDVNRIEKRNQQLYLAGLLKDDISNACMIFRLWAKGHQQVHKSWKYFYDQYESWNVSLYNLSFIADIYADKIVLIIENPSVFSELTNYVKTNEIENVAIICTNGQLNACAYILLDKLQKQTLCIYYCGDFDPEGLSIADRLIKRYPFISLWRYEQHDYERSLSNKKISQSRMNMLQGLQDETLIKLGMKIKEVGVSGYQERLLEAYKNDIKEEKYD